MRRVDEFRLLLPLCIAFHGSHTRVEISTRNTRKPKPKQYYRQRPLMHRTFYIRLARVEEAAGAVGSLFPLEGGMGPRSVVMMLMPAALEGRPRTN